MKKIGLLFVVFLLSVSCFSQKSYNDLTINNIIERTSIKLPKIVKDVEIEQEIEIEEWMTKPFEVEQEIEIEEWMVDINKFMKNNLYTNGYNNSYYNCIFDR